MRARVGERHGKGEEFGGQGARRQKFSEVSACNSKRAKGLASQTQPSGLSCRQCPGKRWETFRFIVSLIRNVCAFAHSTWASINASVLGRHPCWGGGQQQLTDAGPRGAAFPPSHPDGERSRETVRGPSQAAFSSHFSRNVRQTHPVRELRVVLAEGVLGKKCESGPANSEAPHKNGWRAGWWV